MRARLKRAFTIIEILIAIVVLVLGIVGIIALFPTAIDSGNKTIEDSYSAAITQSVVDAITVGLRESRYSYRATGGATWTYFVFNHDGVLDPPPRFPEQFTANQGNYAFTPSPPNPGTGNIWDKDYCIVLPQAVSLSATGVGTSLITGANTAAQNEPNFLYPVPLVPAGEADQHRDSRLASGSVIDNMHLSRWRSDRTGERVPWVPRVYRLGVYRDPGDPPGQSALPGGMSTGMIRQEFRGEQVNVGGTLEDTIAVDPYPTYSFAFAIQRARIDTNNNGRIDFNATPTPDEFSNNLFQVKVFVFKNFNQADADNLGPGVNPNDIIPRNNVPIHQFITLISL